MGQTVAKEERLLTVNEAVSVTHGVSDLHLEPSHGRRKEEMDIKN